MKVYHIYKTMNDRVLLQNAGLHPTAGGGRCLRRCAAANVFRRRILCGVYRGAFRPATVYRALSSLYETGLARRIPADHGALYTLAHAEPSPQLVCSRCGKVEKVNSPAVRHYQTALQKNRGGGAVYVVADCRRKECGHLIAAAVIATFARRNDSGERRWTFVVAAFFA